MASWFSPWLQVSVYVTCILVIQHPLIIVIIWFSGWVLLKVNFEESDNMFYFLTFNFTVLKANVCVPVLPRCLSHPLTWDCYGSPFAYEEPGRAACFSGLLCCNTSIFIHDLRLNESDYFNWCCSGFMSNFNLFYFFKYQWYTLYFITHSIQAKINLLAAKIIITWISWADLR